MNRLFIVGNGFDLAHGMKTQYSDFLKFIITESLEKYYTTGEKSFKLFDIQNNSNQKLYDFVSVLRESPLSKFHEFIDFVKRNSKFTHVLRANNEQKDFTFYCNTRFMAEVFQNTANFNWVDIEQFYFQQFINSFNYEDSKKYGDVPENISLINKDFEILRDILGLYIDSIQLPQLSNTIKSKLFGITTLNDPKDYKNRIATVILNFNYTKLIHKYMESYDKSAGVVRHIQIHGTTNSIQNRIIFGYGDEMYENFKEVETKLSNSDIRNFKSYWYGLTSNYRQLVHFLQSGKYTVEIMGHSCGLSDRLLLNTILENDNCLNIKIHYHKKEEDDNNYFELYQNIGRIFSLNKRADMRKKVASFPEVQPLTI